MYVPQRVFFTCGRGVHKERLTSFEMALREAQIASFNLVRVSSIFPPHCKVIIPREGAESLQHGQIIHCVMSENATNEPNRLIAASIGVAIPKDPDLYGYLSEHHSFGENSSVAGRYAEYLAAEMFATLHNEEMNAFEDYNDKDALWHISDNLVETRNVTQVTHGDESGRWTTVVAAAVLLPG